MAIIEVIDLSTGLAARGEANADTRAALSALLGLRLGAIDDGWSRRLATLPDGAAGIAVDQLFTAAQAKLAALSEQLWNSLAT
jgi:hypothetical protein